MYECIREVQAGKAFAIILVPLLRIWYHAKSWPQRQGLAETSGCNFQQQLQQQQLPQQPERTLHNNRQRRQL